MCWNSQIFVTIATGIGLSKVWVTPLNWRTLKTFYPVQVSRSYLLCELSYGQFCVENHKFLLPWQQGSVLAVWLTPLNRTTLNTPHWVQAPGLYLLHKLSNSPLCVEIRKFSLPWQQGSVWAKFEWHPRIGRHLKPPSRCKCHRHISYASYVVANFVLNWISQSFITMATGVGLSSLADTFK